MKPGPVNSFSRKLQPFACERLQFSLVKPEDADDLQAITNDRSITDAISFLDYPFSRADSLALIHRFSTDKDRVFLGRRRDDGKRACLIGAHLSENRRIEIGYWVATEHQGQGLGFEAIRALVSEIRASLSDHAIFAEVAPENRASWHVLEKAGFRATGEDGVRAGRKLLVYENLG